MEAQPADEAKIAENQRKDEELKKAGTKFVDMKPGVTRATPEQALEPAFDNDKIPPPELKPTPPSARPKQAPTQTASPTKAETPPNDLDMGPPPPKATEATVPPLATDSPGSGAATEIEKTEPPWKSHVILGVTHVKFHKRKVGDLGAAELNIIESQWLPAVREQWDDASDAQRADAAAFESAIAYHKMIKPW
jgi:hypothetical protein